MITRSSPSAEVQRQAAPRPLSPFMMITLGSGMFFAGLMGAAFFHQIMLASIELQIDRWTP